MRGTAVMRHGVLHGMQQHEITCDVVVHMRQAGSKPQFTEGFVISAPPSLPDGNYAVDFDGHTMHVRKDNGHWLYSNEIKSRTISSQPDAPAK